MRRYARGGASRGGRGTHPAVAAALVAACLLFLTLSSCASTGRVVLDPSATPEPAPRSGGVYVVPLDTYPGSLAPFSVGDQAHVEAAHQIFEGLVSYQALEDGTYTTGPCLAESWTANDDATVWTFRLRRGVRFQAPVGREVTARDVVEAFRYGADEDTRSFYAYMYAVLSGTDDEGHAPGRSLGVRALDKYTVRFTLKGSFAAFPDTLGMPHAWVWPVDHLDRVGRSRFERRPVGTGPFLVSRRLRGHSLELVRNPDWWDAPSGRPYVDRLRFVVFPTVTRRQLAFEKGAIDCTWVQVGQAAAARSLPQVTGGEWSAVRLPFLANLFIAFDMEDPIVGGDGGLPLRQAVDCAIDRRAMLADVLEDVDILETGLVPPLLAGWAEAAPPQAYDPTRARRLYESAGSPPLTVAYPSEDPYYSVLAEWVRSALRDAGLDVSLRPLDAAAMYGPMGHGRAPAAIFMTGWMCDYPSADNFLYDLFHSAQSPYTSGTGYRDEDVDRLLELARAEPDAARHHQLNLRAAHEIQADVPVVPLYEYADLRLVSERIGGFARGPTRWTDMWKVWVR